MTAQAPLEPPRFSLSCNARPPATRASASTLCPSRTILLRLSVANLAKRLSSPINGVGPASSAPKVVPVKFAHVEESPCGRTPMLSTVSAGTANAVVISARSACDLCDSKLVPLRSGPSPGSVSAQIFKLRCHLRKTWVSNASVPALQSASIHTHRLRPPDPYFRYRQRTVAVPFLSAFQARGFSIRDNNSNRRFQSPFSMSPECGGTWFRRRAPARNWPTMPGSTHLLAPHWPAQTSVVPRRSAVRNFRPPRNQQEP